MAKLPERADAHAGRRGDPDISTTTTDLIAASRSLDPAGRALLNLWLHRGLGDDDIARLSGGSAAEVAERRSQLVERLAAEVGAPAGEVRAALDQLAAGGPPPPEPAAAAPEPPPAPVAGLVLPEQPAPDEPAAELILPGDPEPFEEAHVILPDEPETSPHAVDELVLPPAAEPEPEPEPTSTAAVELPGATTPGDPEALVLPPGADPEPPPAEPEERPARRPKTTARRSPVPGALGAAVGLALVGTIFAGLLTGGGEKAAEPRPSATPSASPAPPPAITRPLDALPAAPSGVSGTVSREDSRLKLDVRGLEGSPRDYEVWLFESVAEARSLGRLDQGEFELPPDAEGSAAIDVSLERDKNPNHSGRSVLRAELPR